MRDIDAEWRLGVAAVGLDRTNRRVHLADGDTVPFGRMLIATGTRARPWFNPEEAKLEGVFTLRTSDDAARLQAALPAGPGRVLIIGAGFIGSEMASVCRELGLNVTVAEHADSPLIGALGGVIGEIAAEMQRDAGVDLRTGVGSIRWKETAPDTCGGRSSPTAPRSTSTWWCARSGRSATPNGWRVPVSRPASGGSAATPAAALSTSTGS